jgi:hypothetical protein
MKADELSQMGCHSFRERDRAGGGSSGSVLVGEGACLYES